MEEASKDILKAVFDKVNSEDSFAQSIRMKLIKLQSGFARATLPISDGAVNMYQIAHGGAILRELLLG